jgi:hypothetical protein
VSNFLSTFGKAAYTAAVVALASAPKYVGWGTGNSATVASTDLSAAAAESRNSVSISQETTSVAGDTVRAVGTLTCAGADKTITEAGTFTTLATATLCTYVTFAGLPILVGDSITFTLDTQLT